MILGLASGMTAGEALLYPVDRLDVLEINDQAVRAAELFNPWNNACLSSPRTRIIVQDGRNHLELTKEQVRRHHLGAVEPLDGRHGQPLHP